MGCQPSAPPYVGDGLGDGNGEGLGIGLGKPEGSTLGLAEGDGLGEGLGDGVGHMFSVPTRKSSEPPQPCVSPVGIEYQSRILPGSALTKKRSGVDRTLSTKARM